MNRMNPNTSRARVVAMIVLLGSSFIGIWGIAVPVVANAQVHSEDDLATQKEYWQNRYRTLRQDEARLKRNIESAEEAYAEANRRNYRRGKIRHVYRAELAEAEAELAKVQAELNGIVDEGRRSGALPGWFYEVEDEPISLPPRPVARDLDDEDPDAAGRNPLYLQDEDEDEDADADSADENDESQR